MKLQISLIATLLIAATLWAGQPPLSLRGEISEQSTPVNPHAVKPHPKPLDGSLSPVAPREPRPERDGDTMDDPIPIALGGYAINNTEYFNDDYDEVCPYSGSTSPDVVYVLDLLQQTSIELYLCDSYYDTKVYVYDEYQQVMGCNDDACGYPYGYKCQLFIYDLPPETYYIIVDGWAGDAGEFELWVFDITPPPVGNCQEAHTPDEEWDAFISHNGGAEGNYLWAERFQDGGIIEELQVTGFSLDREQIYWYECWENPMELEVSFYQHGISPGVEVCSYTIETTPQLTGYTYDGYLGYEFNLVLPAPLAMEEGWFSVQSFNTCWFLWVTASEGDDLASVSIDGGPWESYPWDLNFCLTLQPPSPPPPPPYLEVEQLGGGEVWLGWGVPEPGVDYYTVYRDGDFVDTTPTNEYYDQLPAWGGYCYTVTATNSAGESAPCDPQCTEWEPEQIYFDPVNPTGMPYAVIVQEAWLGTSPLQAGDEIGIYDGDLCVGAGVVWEWPLTITVWEAIDYPPMPGFTPGNPIHYRVWSDGDAMEYPADAFYLTGNGTFGHGPYSEVIVNGCNTPIIDLSADAHDFGEVMVGESTDWVLSIYNDGGIDLMVDEITCDNSIFSTDFIPPATIPPGGSYAVEVYFTPDAEGPHVGTLSISSNDPEHNPATVDLAGYGTPVPIPDIALSDFEHDFGEVLLGDAAIWDFTMYNVGTDDLEVYDITSDLAVFTTDFGPRLIIPPGNFATVNVTFTPVEAIVYDGDLVISSNDPDEETVVVHLEGTGLQPPAGDIDLSETAYDFGGVTIGESDDWELLISNLGDEILNVTSITSDEPAFTTNFVPRFPIPPGAYATITVTFTPLEEIVYSGVLTIESDDPDEPEVTVDLTGEGLAALPPTPFALLTPSDGATVTTASPLLTWEESTDPDGWGVTYNLYWDTDPDFPDPESVAGLTETEYTLIGLEDDTEYFWRVWAHDDNTPGTPCDADFSFTVGVPEPPLPFSLLAPPDGSTLGPPITFIWEETSDPDPGDVVSYLLLLAPDPDFTDTTLAVELDAVQYYLDDLEPGEYWWHVLAQDGNTAGTWSTETWSFLIPDGIFDNLHGIPTRFAIVSVYPNPFNPSTNIAFGMPAAGWVEAEVYDLTGRLTDTRVLGLCQPGYHQFTWTAGGSSGIYFLRLYSDQGWEDIRRMVYLK